MKPPRLTGWPRAALYVVWVCLMAAFFAMVEIQIEGDAGWAASLPTWRIEKHWALDVFWGGRAMTGYHAWVFSFMALAFVSPLVFAGRASWPDAGLALAGLMLFWAVEDFIWFMLNPAFGWARFEPAFIPWHTRWWLGVPVDYWIGIVGASALLVVVVRSDPRPA